MFLDGFHFVKLCHLHDVVTCQNQIYVVEYRYFTPDSQTSQNCRLFQPPEQAFNSQTLSIFFVQRAFAAGTFNNSGFIIKYAFLQVDFFSVFAGCRSNQLNASGASRAFYFLVGSGFIFLSICSSIFTCSPVSLTFSSGRGVLFFSISIS